MKRLGILGGSFNPVHYGHLLLAETAREECQLEQVWFVPTAIPPHKPPEALADPRHRLEMLKLAIAGDPHFDTSTAELDRPGISYTADTLNALAREDAGRELFLILGADALFDLPTWHQPERICQLATLIIARRPGSAAVSFDGLAPFASAERIEHFKRHCIEMPAIDISSRDLRRRVASGRSIRYRTPRAVEEYIRAAGLYRSADEAATDPRPPAKRSCGG